MCLLTARCKGHLLLHASTGKAGAVSLLHARASRLVTKTGLPTASCRVLACSGFAGVAVLPVKSCCFTACDAVFDWGKTAVTTQPAVQVHADVMVAWHHLAWCQHVVCLEHGCREWCLPVHAWVVLISGRCHYRGMCDACMLHSPDGRAQYVLAIAEQCLGQVLSLQCKLLHEKLFMASTARHTHAFVGSADWTSRSPRAC